MRDTSEPTRRRETNEVRTSSASRKALPSFKDHPSSNCLSWYGQRLFSCLSKSGLAAYPARSVYFFDWKTPGGPTISGIPHSCIVDRDVSCPDRGVSFSREQSCSSFTRQASVHRPASKIQPKIRAHIFTALVPTEATSPQRPRVQSPIFEPVTSSMMVHQGLRERRQDVSICNDCNESRAKGEYRREYYIPI